MNLKKRIEELHRRVAAKPAVTDRARAAARSWLTDEEWADYVAGKPLVFRIITPKESAYFLEEIIDGQLKLTRLGVHESDRIEAVERIRAWKPPAESGCGLLANFRGNFENI